MTLHVRKDRADSWIIKPCWYVNPYGDKCRNSGAQMDIVLEAVNQEISKYEDKILTEINSVDDSYVKGIEDSIKEKESFIKRKEIALVKVKVAYREGVDTLDEYKESKDAINKEIATLKEDIKILELRLKHADTKVSIERLDIIKEFKGKL